MSHQQNQAHKSKIKKVDQPLNLPQIEEAVSNFWENNNIFEKSIEQRSDESRYVFVDGPPFVTGIPHWGSLLCSIAKDVIPRFMTMKGKKVRRVFGWDCHGLPIEEKINKKFNITSSKQLESELGVERYIQECRNWVSQCTNDWAWYVRKIGRWVDMKNAYYTMSTEFMESVIWAFKQMYEKGYIYKGKRVSLFSTDTSTPVSEFEVAMDPDNYKDVDDLAVFVKFQIKPDQGFPENSYLIAWTTTPWTIPSNFALAVNPDADYVLVAYKGEHYVLAKSRVEQTFSTNDTVGSGNARSDIETIKVFKGSELEGLRYVPVYDFFTEESTPNDFKVYLFEGVTTEDGTGVLHIAPAFGEEDFMLGKKYGLSDHADIDEYGKMLVGPWHGVYLRDAAESIAKDLERKGNLFRSEVYRHRLPFFRGSNPLIYMAQDAYFVDIQKIKQRMLELNEGINWVPSHIKHGRFSDVVKNSPDWCISRNRYWATIMPIWKSDDGDEIVIGSIEEMMQYTDQIKLVREEGGKKYYEFEGQPMDLHRDVCDRIVLVKNGKEYRRIPEVLDCWMDSGSAPFAEYHYPFENKDIFEKNYPADFIVEYVGQVRAWFNVLLRVSTIVFDNAAFKNAVVTGNLAGNDGRKMSKSYGNYTDPVEVLQKIGAEPVRLFLMGSGIMSGTDANWSDDAVNEQVKNVLLPFWNVYKYFTIYADVHGWTPVNADFDAEDVLDRWLESLVKKASLEYSKALEDYDVPRSVKIIQPTIDAISTWWIRRSRERFVEGDHFALQNLYAALVLLVKSFAPQLAFLTEEIYQNIVRGVLPDAKESVHLEDYPMIQESDVDDSILVVMEKVRQICSLGNNLRNTHSIKSRQPLSMVVVCAKNGDIDLDSRLIQIIKDELNVQAVSTDRHLLGKEGFVLAEDSEYIVALDITISQDLYEQGLYAEMKRQVQNLRKTLGFSLGELVNITLEVSDQEIAKLIGKWSETLKNDCSIAQLEMVSELGPEGNELKLGESIKLRCRFSR